MQAFLLTDMIHLSGFFESETVAPGLFTISLYFDGQRAGMGMIKVAE